MTRLPGVTSIRTTKAYDEFLKASYAGVKPRAEEVDVPRIAILSVAGRQPPTARPFQDAIGVLYGIGYGLKMGLKFGTLPRPAGYFDYKVGALEVFWWSTGRTFDISNARTLRWQAFLMVPPFVTRTLVNHARALAADKHPELPYGLATLERIREGRAVQMLHVGRYDREQATIDALHAYAADHGLAVTGRHHEIYISDPRRTPSAKLKTVIRLAVTPAARPQRRRSKAR